MGFNRVLNLILFAIMYFCCCSIGLCAEKTINLEVGYKPVFLAGKLRNAIAINDQTPGPTLRFQEGDHVTIHVHNCLNEPTSIHWHGVLVPWQMDGVEGVAQKGIPPHGTYTYQFTLKQSGTYWYHSHAGLQEQQGLYGAFIVYPSSKPTYHYDRDFVMVLSDWINENPNQVLANLKKSGDYYDPRFPLQPSLVKFIHDYRLASPCARQKLMTDYTTMQKMRMSIYDLSDVAYDAFLLNGKSNSCPWNGLVKKGDIVRLRFIGASAGTIFRVKIPEHSMQVIHIQGNDVRPFTVSDFKIAPGETVDVLVKINQTNTIIYAESIDKVGAAYGALLTYPYHPVDYKKIIPFPEPLPVTQEMMNNMQLSMHHADHSDMTHSMHMSTEPTQIGDTIEPISSFDSDGMTDHAHPSFHDKMADHAHPLHASSHEKMIHIDHSSSTEMNGIPYQTVQAARVTNDPQKPIFGVIKMELFGYMDHFIWFINGVPGYKAKPICLEPNRRYRIIFTNTSMMHHPMHIHGHWFILRNGHGSYDPLLHTIDVPPGATVTADVDTDASGQWFFHCHLLYHMSAGMSRVFQYSTLIELAEGEIAPENQVTKTNFYNRPIVRVDEIYPLNLALIKNPMPHPEGFWFKTILDMGVDPFNNTERLTYKGLYGTDYHKLELFTNDAEIDQGQVENADMDIFYWHLLSQFWAVKGGANYFYRPALSPYWQPGVGIEGLMPYFIDTDVRGYYHNGSAKLDIELSRATQITNNFFIQLGIRSILATKTVKQAAIGSGLNQMRYTFRPFYRLFPGLTVYTEYEHDHNYGAFRRIELNAGQQPTAENTVTLGLTALF